MKDNVNELINSIVQISFNNLPVEEGWEKYEVQLKTIRLYTEMEAFYILDNGECISFNPKYSGQVAREDNLRELFMDLRKAMYDLSPQQGAWFSCTITVYPTGKFTTDFNYDDDPEFTYHPDPREFADDLKTFPREKGLIPDWLNDILKAK
jgi:hypothetical protein